MSLCRIFGKEHALALFAPSPARLSQRNRHHANTYRAITDEGSVLAAPRGIVWRLDEHRGSRRTNALGPTASEKQALTLAAPSPAHLGGKTDITIKNEVIAAPTWIVRTLIRRTDSLVRIISEKQALALVAPSPSTLRTHFSSPSLT
jgi:hypothetical protein